MKHSTGRRALAALTLAAFTSCASTTIIQSQPPGARVYLNNEPVGTTPYAMTDTKLVGSSTYVRLEYPGYEPLAVTITRDEELDVGACIAGVFLLVPFLWIMRYKPSHTYELRPGPGGPPAYRYPPPAAPPPPQ